MNDHGDDGMEWNDDDCDESIALHNYEIAEILADYKRDFKLDIADDEL
tara:strand:- start:353 stop:496 length:144 start_codon:yes stop_codon:yes gene_type:complete